MGHLKQVPIPTTTQLLKPYVNQHPVTNPHPRVLTRFFYRCYTGAEGETWA